ncbi:MAG TPA: hypothetical protein VFI22_14225, partial [Thermomicrobiales bacterium]|nr:hypothetical protein [Thermomicrobiales bacterium]
MEAPRLEFVVRPRGFAMRRRAIWVLPLAVLLLGVVALPGRFGAPAGAQSATPAPTTAGHPLVGAWVLDTDVADP